MKDYKTHAIRLRYSRVMLRQTPYRARFIRATANPALAASDQCIPGIPHMRPCDAIITYDIT